MANKLKLNFTGSVYDSKKNVKENTAFKNYEIEGLGKVLSLDIELIYPKKDQVRKYFSEEKLNELARSIEQFGVLKPIIVQEKEENTYEIVAGERRWRASKIAGLRKVPVILKEVSDYSADAIGIIENIQSEKLNWLEEAYALQNLARKYNLSHDKVGELVGKSRSAVSNTIRMTSLPDRTIKYMMENQVDIGHAKIIAKLDEDLQMEVLGKIVSNALTVRDTERLVNSVDKEGKQNLIARELNELNNIISQKINKKTKLTYGKNEKIKLQISFCSIAELNDFIDSK